jgi:flagellar hook-associated protein 1 FlgK
MALPVLANSALENKGSAEITVTEITNTTGLPVGNANVLGNAFSVPGKLTPPIMIQFTSATTYQIYNISNGEPGTPIGPEQQYSPTSMSNEIFPVSGVVNSTPPGPNSTYVYDPGYRISISGVAQMGDVFTIGFNTDPSGDNRNGLMLANLEFTQTMVNGTSTFQDAYAQFVGLVGGQAEQAFIDYESKQSLMLTIELRRNEISAVNLDEEAANLLKYEQLYQATAQVIVASKLIFDALLSAIGG